MPGGARGLMPAEYAYTLPRDALAALPSGRYAVPRPGLGAAPAAPTTGTSAPFSP